MMRLPTTHTGVAGPPDEEGYVMYQRPEGKSGGHGVGWSEIPRYKFKVWVRKTLCPSACSLPKSPLLCA